jgi:hypothetical protein
MFHLHQNPIRVGKYCGVFRELTTLFVMQASKNLDFNARKSYPLASWRNALKIFTYSKSPFVYRFR